MGAIGKTLEKIGDRLERVVDKSLGLDALYEEEPNLAIWAKENDCSVSWNLKEEET